MIVFGNKIETPKILSKDTIYPNNKNTGNNVNAISESQVMDFSTYIVDNDNFLFRPLLRGEELYTQMVFLQTIFADRYIHRRELRLVSLESSSSVEYGIKKIFLFLFFFTVSYQG